MKRNSITQEYYTLMITKDGIMPPMNKEKAAAGLVAAGFLDLLSQEIIVIEKKKILVKEELPEELRYLETLYQYLRKTPRTIHMMMSVFSIGVRNRQLAENIGKSLLEKGLATYDKGILFAPKNLYVPEKTYKEELVTAVRAVVNGTEEMEAHDILLLHILKVSKCLNQYFSKYEKERLSARIKEIRKNPQNRQVEKMILYVTDITNYVTFAVVAAVGMG